MPQFTPITFRSIITFCRSLLFVDSKPCRWGNMQGSTKKIRKSGLKNKVSVCGVVEDERGLTTWNGSCVKL